MLSTIPRENWHELVIVERVELRAYGLRTLATLDFPKYDVAKKKKQLVNSSEQGE